MKFRYTTKQGIFEANDYFEIPWSKLHSLNDEAAFVDLLNEEKVWFFEGKYHRETGPAIIWPNGHYSFWLNDKLYDDVNDWLIDNPNKDITFQAYMRLKYT